MSEDFKIPTLEEVFKATDDIFELIDIVDNTYKNTLSIIDECYSGIL